MTGKKGDMMKMMGSREFTMKKPWERRHPACQLRAGPKIFCPQSQGYFHTWVWAESMAMRGYFRFRDDSLFEHFQKIFPHE